MSSAKLYDRRRRIVVFFLFERVLRMFCHECLKFLCSYLGFQYSGFNEENFTICLENLRDCSELNNGNIQDFF